VLVLHLLPVDVARGAQIFAATLVQDANQSGPDRHELVVLFTSGPGVLPAKYRLGVSPSALRRVGFSPLAAWRLHRLISRTRPDAVVAHGGEVLKYLAVTRPPVSVVGHAIGVMPSAATHGGRRALHRWAWRVAAVVVAVSADVALQLTGELGLPADRVRVIPNGRDPQHFRPADSAPRRARLLFVGHLTASKRPELFLQVVHRLNALGLDFDAMIVGDGPLRASLEGPASGAGVALIVDQHDVADVLRTGSLLLFTSDSVNEGMPGVLIEAGLTGLPVVTTDVPGARDVVLDGRTGSVVPVGDVEAVIRESAILLTDESRRAAMGAAAREHCERHFGIVRATEAWQRALHAAVAGARG